MALSKPSIATNLHNQYREQLISFQNAMFRIGTAVGLTGRKVFDMHGPFSDKDFGPEDLKTALAYLEILTELAEEKTKNFETPETTSQRALQNDHFVVYRKPTEEIQWIIKTTIWLMKACDGDARRLKETLETELDLAEFGPTTLRRLLVGRDSGAAMRGLEHFQSQFVGAQTPEL